MKGGSSRLVNTYLNDSNIEGHNGSCLYVVVDSFQDLGFEEFDSFMKQHKEYVNDYEVLDGMYIVYIFTFPKEQRQDLNRFLLGRYSGISPESKEIILSYAYKSSNFLTSVFSKSKELREALEDKFKVSIDSDTELEEIISSKISNLNIEMLPKKKTYSQTIKKK